MCMYVKDKMAEDVRYVPLAWHALCLYDIYIGCTCAFASMDFSRIYKFDYCPAIIGLMPVTLVCCFQVHWAIGIHILYLTIFDAIAAAQEETVKKQ